MDSVVGAAYDFAGFVLERITIDPDVVHGRPAIRGMRIRVSDVLSMPAGGATEAEIL